MITKYFVLYMLRHVFAMEHMTYKSHGMHDIQLISMKCII